ncbi:MAG: pyridoxamine 5'-phosphate oxidase [Actinomycetota bacterium]|nr:pyridoxamine 5'-phosphate oxidase [Actinomycetota bacterium]
MTDPAALRRTYLRGALSESTVAGTWLVQLRCWFDEAVEAFGWGEANAMQVATVDERGLPSLRTVLAKGIDERGVSFFTNFDSAKGRELAARPYAAAQFVWQSHERQVRLRGRVARVSREETEAYFATRPRGSQLGAWASPQSQVIASRAVLDDELAAVERRFAARDVPAPPNWGGFLIAPDLVEFWQGRADRLHDRLRFRLDDGAWAIERLAP